MGLNIQLIANSVSIKKFQSFPVSNHNADRLLTTEDTELAQRAQRYCAPIHSVFSVPSPRTPWLNFGTLELWNPFHHPLP
jgi:hypothetical protein